MASMQTMMLTRLIPVGIMVSAAYFIPYAQRSYLITGMSGDNFQQTDVSQCDVLHTDTLIGCEDLHLYNAPSGPMIFTGCVDKITDQFVPFPSNVGLR